MKLRRLVLLVWAAIALGLPAVASAHIVQTDGSTTGLLHINPNDEPVAGQTATLGFSITDTAGRFTAPACDCRIIVQEGGQVLTTLPVGAAQMPSNGVILTPYTFPYRAVYDLTLVGTPRQAGGFQPFRLSYTIRVDQGPTKPASPWMAWGLVGLAAVVLAVAGSLGYREWRTDRRHSTRRV